MKFKTLVASVALSVLGTAVAGAADMPVKAPPPPPPPVPIFSWTGFNDGGNNGAFIGGGQVGVNYQVNNFVIGAEWDFDWAANHNNGSGVVTPGGDVIGVNVNNRWITTLAARF